MDSESNKKGRYDQNRLCCGHLLEAVVVDGEVLLKCLACSRLWGRSVSGAIEPRPHTALPE